MDILIQFLAVDSLIKFLMLNAVLSEEAQHRGRPTYSLLTIRGEDGKIAREEEEEGRHADCILLGELA